jgi:hypothetical protein
MTMKSRPRRPSAKPSFKKSSVKPSFKKRFIKSNPGKLMLTNLRKILGFPTKSRS